MKNSFLKKIKYIRSTFPLLHLSKLRLKLETPQTKSYILHRFNQIRVWKSLSNSPKLQIGITQTWEVYLLKSFLSWLPLYPKGFLQVNRSIVINLKTHTKC